jgi:hypothetical protein
VGFLKGSSFVTLKATGNSDGTYSFTVPSGVKQVILAAKGDIVGDGQINMGSVSTLYAHIKRTHLITGDRLFVADISGDSRVNMGDVSMLYAHVKKTKPLNWDP